MNRSVKNRLMLYVHFDRDGIVDSHVLYQLCAFSKFGIKIVFLSNSAVPETQKQELSALVSELVIRPNEGFDFGAWKDFLLSRDRAFFSALDELLLCNSTCYGPFFPLSELFNGMDRKECDFWGVTKCSAFDDIPAHVQPYFLIFRSPMFLSDSFWRFWETLKAPRTYDEAIHNGEIYFSQYFHSAGFRSAVYVDSSDQRILPALEFEEPLCISSADWLISRYRAPLIKIKSFRTFPNRYWCKSGEILNALRLSGSLYPVGLIQDHLERTAPFSWKKNLPGTLRVLPSQGEILPDSGLKIAVFLHLFYSNTLKEALTSLRNIPYRFDLFITVCGGEVESEVAALLKECGLNLGCSVIRRVPNSGGDALPWLTAFRDIHLNYDLALKFQIKKSLQTPEILERGQNEFQIRSLLHDPAYVSEILHLFCRDRKLGLVFSSAPPIFQLAGAVESCGTPESSTHRKNWLTRLGLRVPEEEDSFRFPVGMFWYRPQALEKLLTCDVQASEFPEEPASQTETVVKGLEMALPGIAQGHGFGCRLVIPERELIGSFQIYEDWLMSSRRRFEYLYLPTVNFRKAVYVLGKAVLNSYRFRFPGIAKFLEHLEKPLKKIIKKLFH